MEVGTDVTGGGGGEQLWRVWGGKKEVKSNAAIITRKM